MESIVHVSSKGLFRGACQDRRMDMQSLNTLSSDLADLVPACQTYTSWAWPVIGQYTTSGAPREWTVPSRGELPGRVSSCEKPEADQTCSTKKVAPGKRRSNAKAMLHACLENQDAPVDVFPARRATA